MAILFSVLLPTYLDVNTKTRGNLINNSFVPITANNQESRAIMITITDQTANLFKDSFQRLRPCYNESLIDSVRLVKESCGGKYGFFSNHVHGCVCKVRG